MRLLRIVCSGYPLFKESETIDLIASQRVTEEDSDQMTPAPFPEILQCKRPLQVNRFFDFHSILFLVIILFAIICG